MADLRLKPGVSAKALEFAILTAARTGEAIGARWDELDLDARVWTIPAARMKASREHRVPLSDRVVEILQGLPREGDFVFVGPRGRPLSNTAMLSSCAACAARARPSTDSGARASRLGGQRDHLPARARRARLRTPSATRPSRPIGDRIDGAPAGLDGRMGDVLRGLDCTGQRRRHPRAFT